MASFKDWWEKQSDGRKLSIAALAGIIISRVAMWLLEKAATLAYEKALEAFMSPQRAQAMKEGVSSFAGKASTLLSSDLVLGFALALGMVVAFPYAIRATNYVVALVDAFRRGFLAKVGKQQQLATLAVRAMVLARLSRDLAEEATRYEGHPLSGKYHLSEEEKSRIWREYVEDSSNRFQSVMARFRKDVHLEARPIIKQMVALGHLSTPPRGIDHVTNTFCIGEIASALAEGAGAIFHDLESRGFNVDQYRAAALQPQQGTA